MCPYKVWIISSIYPEDTFRKLDDTTSISIPHVKDNVITYCNTVGNNMNIDKNYCGKTIRQLIMIIEEHIDT